MNNAKGENTHYTYNNDSIVTAIRNGRNYSRTYTYNARHEVTRLDMPDGTYEQWSYNANGVALAGVKRSVAEFAPR